MPKSFWDNSNGPIAIAHRGGGAMFGNQKHRRENTIEAFKNAQKLGYKYLETDVIYTKDKQLIVLHVAKNRFEAARGLREAPSYYKLQKLTYAQIKQLMGRDIPTLKESLVSFPKAKFFIEPKTDQAVGPLAELVKSLAAQDRVSLNSFYIHRVKELRRLLGPTANLGLIVSRYPKFLNQYMVFLLSGAYKDLGLECVGLPKMLMNSKSVKTLHKHGYKVVVWTLNDPPEIELAVSLGVDGIISDQTELLKNMLSQPNRQ